MSFIRTKELYGINTSGHDNENLYQLHVYDLRSIFETKYAFEMINLLEALSKAHGYHVPLATYLGLKEYERIYSEDTDFNKGTEDLYGTEDEQRSIYEQQVRHNEWVEQRRIKNSGK